MDNNERVELKSRSGQEEADQDQYLTFFMADEEYGIDILSIQEIRGCDNTTCIPNSPNFIQGVLNLRGTIVPIVDLRLRFGLEKITYGDITVVIVVKADLDDGEKTIGMVVDAVSDVYSVDQQESTRAPDVGEAQNREYVKGLVNVGEKMVVLLDLKKILTFSNV
ncbi:MAG: purine-binding chemotaxis protein CheW [Phenylobacterium sp.]|jgi:purine-binding chemotaxis protein CheW